MMNHDSAEIAVPELAGQCADDRLSALARAALDAGMPANTRAAYTRAWKEFTTWCQRAGRTPLPATSVTLAEYVTYLCYERIPVTPQGVPIPGRVGLSPTSISQAQWAIAKAHELAEIDPPHAKKAVQVIKGYKARLAEDRDPRARPQKATAADQDALISLQDATAADGLIGLRDQVMFLLHIFLAARVSEVVGLNIENVEISPRGLLVSVYRQKTREFNDLAIPCEDAPGTVDVTRRWTGALAERGRASGPLFVRIDRHGNVGSGAGRPGPVGVRSGVCDGRISVRAAEERIHRAVTLAGLDGRWSGHSFRRGFATEASRAGHDKLSIARRGGWAPNSEVLDGYIEEADIWTRSPLKGIGI